MGLYFIVFLDPEMMEVVDILHHGGPGPVYTIKWLSWPLITMGLTDSGQWAPEACFDIQIDILKDLMKSWRNKIGRLDNRISLKFMTHLCSSAAIITVKFQGNKTITNTHLKALSLWRTLCWDIRYKKQLTCCSKQRQVNPILVEACFILDIIG